MPKLLMIVLLSSLSLPCRADLIDDTPDVLGQKVAQGDRAAMCELGNRLIRGRSLDRDPVRGEVLVRKSAELGDADCQYYLAMMYQEGRWLSSSPALALDWFNKAAKQGSAVAQIELGLIHEKGLNGTKQDLKRSLDWFGRAAKQGHAVGMFHYGRLLLKPHRAEGLAWLQLAGEKGDYDAQILLNSTPISDGADRKAYEKSLQKLRSSMPGKS